MKTLITGSAGFLGSHLVRTFEAAGHEVLPLPSMVCDLRNLAEATATFRAVKPDLLIHAAGRVGGVAYNLAHQAEIFYANMLINLQTLEAAREAGIPHVISISSACAYGTPQGVFEMSEESLWRAEPDPSVLGYGTAKRLQEVQGRLYRQQYSVDVRTLLLSNLYGPGDNFGETAHVVPALIKRFVEAKAENLPEVVVWGTGRAVRDMLYVEDAAEAVLRFASSDVEDVLNIGTGQGYKVREIAQTIQAAVRYTGNLRFDDTKPEGQMFKVLNANRMKEALGWTPPTDLTQGIAKTVEWYLKSGK